MPVQEHPGGVLLVPGTRIGLVAEGDPPGAKSRGTASHQYNPRRSILLPINSRGGIASAPLIGRGCDMVLCTVVLLADVLRQRGSYSERLRAALADRLERPTFGQWRDLLRAALEDLPRRPGSGRTDTFVLELPAFVRDRWLPRLGSGTTRYW